MLGSVRGAEKEACLRGASVFLLPSYAEGLPMAILEARAHGLAVVTTPVGGIPDAITDGETGILIPPGDIAALTAACICLLRNSELRSRLGEAARQRARDRFAVQGVLARL